MNKILAAANAQEFKIALARIDIHVPARTAGRKKDQTERYSIAHLMASLPAEEISFPLCLNHQERPDFVLHMTSSEIGIEHIEAVPENHVRASIFRQNGVGPKVHLLQRHRPGESSRSNNVILSEINKDKAGPPWVGNEVEVEWADVMLHCVKGKIETLNKAGFTKFESNWLLIYNNWPMPGVHHAEASAMLADSCISEGLLNEFSRIFVLDSKVLCEISKITRLHPVREPSAVA